MVIDAGEAQILERALAQQGVEQLAFGVAGVDPAGGDAVERALSAARQFIVRFRLTLCCRSRSVI